MPSSAGVLLKCLRFGAPVNAHSTPTAQPLPAAAAHLKNQVITSIAAGGQSGLLSVLLHKAISTVVAQAASEGFEMQRAGDAATAAAGAPAAAATPPPAPAAAAGGSADAAGAAERAHAVAFADALLSLVQALASSTTGLSALADAGVVSSLMPLLRDTHPDHVGLVVAAVRILETLVDFSQSALTLFRWVVWFFGGVQRKGCGAVCSKGKGQLGRAGGFQPVGAHAIQVRGVGAG